jgi:hypothetical protein
VAGKVSPQQTREEAKAAVRLLFRGTLLSSCPSVNAFHYREFAIVAVFRAARISWLYEAVTFSAITAKSSQEAVLQEGGPTHFLIELDKYDSVTGKESEDPELRAEDFIHLQHLAGVLKAEGPTPISKDDAQKLRKKELIASHRDGKVWIVEKP